MSQHSLFLGCNNIFLFVFIIVCGLFVVCGCKTTETIYKTEIEYVVIKPSNALLEECAPLQTKEIKTNGDLAAAYTSLMFDYMICSNKLKTIKQFYSEYNNNSDGSGSQFVISGTTSSEE